jgi:hypothetical protein
MAFQPAPGAHQQPEPVIEAITNLSDRHRQHPRGCQFNPQRDPVEAPADLDDYVGLAGRGQRDGGRDRLRPVDE